MTAANSTMCQNHSGIEAEIGGIKSWQDYHDKTVHPELNKKIDRLPTWAVWSMTMMGTVIGFLIGLLSNLPKG